MLYLLFLAYISIVISYSSIFGAFFFNKQNIIYFLNLYSQFCLDYWLLESEKVIYLLLYCEFFTKNYIKILIKEAD